MRPSISMRPGITLSLLLGAALSICAAADPHPEVVDWAVEEVYIPGTWALDLDNGTLPGEWDIYADRVRRVVPDAAQESALARWSDDASNRPDLWWAIDIADGHSLIRRLSFMSNSDWCPVPPESDLADLSLLARKQVFVNAPIAFNDSARDVAGPPDCPGRVTLAQYYESSCDEDIAQFAIDCPHLMVDNGSFAIIVRTESMDEHEEICTKHYLVQVVGVNGDGALLVKYSAIPD